MEEKLKIILESQNPWWYNESFESGIERLHFFPKLTKYLTNEEILFLVGVRRTGKSTLMYQMIKKLLRSNSAKAILFLNLDEPFFQSQFDNPNFLTQIIDEYMLENKGIDRFYIFVDEIQIFPFWSQTLKILYDTKKSLKLIASGSSSNLIESKLSLKLSGRYFYEKIYPLSFNEIVSFTTNKKLRIVEKRNIFESYLKYGGFPRVVLESDESLKKEILKNYFQTIYMKDIVLPNNIRNNRDVFDLLYYLVTNVSKYFSYSSIAKILEISVDTVREYITYTQSSCFIYMLNKYDVSLKKQLKNQKKIYCVDTGILNVVSFRFSEDRGRIFENLVFINLMKLEKEVYYHKGNYECDFVLKEGLKIVDVIQVCVSLDNEVTKKREIRGLVEAMKTYDLKEGFLVTENENETIIVEGRTVNIVSFDRWIEKLK